MRRAALVGVPGSFAVHADMPVLTAMWVAMLVELARDSGLNISRENAIKVVTALTSTVMSVFAALRLGGFIFKYTPVTFLAITAVNCGANAGCTLVIGEKIANIFNAIDFDEMKAASSLLRSTSSIAMHVPDQFAEITGMIELWGDGAETVTNLFEILRDLPSPASCP